MEVGATMSEWKTSALKAANVRVRKGDGLTSRQMKEGEYPVVAGGLSYCGTHNSFNRNENSITVSASGANAGAILFHKSKIFATDCSTVEWDGSQVFLYYALAHRQKEFTAMQSGLAQPHVYPRDIEKFILSYPIDIKEQFRIAAVLASADEAVAASRALVERYAAVKQGLMQDLLGKGKPIRLGNVCSVVGGSTPTTSEGKYWNGKHVWITPTDLSVLESVTIDGSQRHLSDEGLRRATGRLLPENSVIISCRAPVGYCAVVTVPFSFNQGCKALVCHAIHPIFLYYQLSGAKEQLENFSSGTTFLELPRRELERFEVHCPDLDEQQRIAEILLAADARLTAERERLRKLENIKRGLMDDLLTNRVSTDKLQRGA